MSGTYKGRVLSHKGHLTEYLTANPALRRKSRLDTENQFKVQNLGKSLCDHKFPKVGVETVSLESNSCGLSSEALAELCGYNFSTSSEGLNFLLSIYVIP